MSVQYPYTPAKADSDLRCYTGILLKLSELLLEERLITPEEKLRLTDLIRKEQHV